MKMKDIPGLLLVLLAMLTPSIMMVVVGHIGGSPSSFEDMAMLGPMKCEWTNGQVALMSNGGHQRLYELRGQRVELGKVYRVRRGLGMKWIPGRAYLWEI